MTVPPPIPDRVPSSWGGPLDETDYATLSASWITPGIAEEALLRRVNEQEGREVIGQKGSRDCAGILFPYYWPGQTSPINYRLRRDHPDIIQGKDGNLRQDRKYLSSPNGRNRLYIPPGVTPEQLADARIPIAIVEGEKKALALWRLARHESKDPRFIPVAIAGVWSWRGRIGKTSGPRGERIDVSGPIPDLDRIEWKGRKVCIIFDADVQNNESVKRARKGIARELATRGAEGEFVNLPTDCGVNGVDDLLAAWGPERLLDLFAKGTRAANLEAILPPQFQSRPEGMFRVTRKGELLTEIRLSNYRASIKANILLDDGVDTRREFEIESELLGRKFGFTVSSAEFASMDWPIKEMGPAAITFPNQRDYARTAIQCHSFTAEDRCIYAHTGWRKIDGRWIYLHANGGIGKDGAIDGAEVRLFGALSRYELRLPTCADSLVRAARASLRLIELGPPSISFPLRAATCRAVLGSCDFSLHLAGETGAFKSELAALEQQHFGAGMNRIHLPGAWSSTGNALEVLAFHAKDALIVIDDFAPQGNTSDVARYHAAADRVFRAAGNHAGRGRLDSTAKLREPKPPRGLILSTGEDIPREHSVRARLLISELAKGDIKPYNLAKCQKDAAAGLYAEAMGGFARWMAGRYDEVRISFDRKVAELRLSALGNPAHARTPEIIANLQAGFELYLEFCEECGVLDRTERDRLAGRCWAALREAATAQDKHQKTTEPTARFLALLLSLLPSGRAHLNARNGHGPDRSPESCGCRMVGLDRWSPLGECIDWVDDDDIYLEPAATYRLVQLAGRDAGEVLAVSEQTLKKRLREKGLLKSTDPKREMLTVRRTIGGTSKDVLHFSRATILPEEPESENGADDEGE